MHFLKKKIGRNLNDETKISKSRFPIGSKDNLGVNIVIVDMVVIMLSVSFVNMLKPALYSVNHTTKVEQN